MRPDAGGQVGVLLENRVVQYSLAPLLVAVATLAADALHPVLPFLPVYLYLGAVVASGWLGGRIAGLLAASIAPLALDYYFFPPLHTLGFSAEDEPYIIPFLLSALAAAWMSSARNRAHEEQTRNVQLAAAVEQGPRGIMITGVSGKIKYVNPAFTRLTGYTAGELTGQNPRMLKSGKHDTRFYEEMWRTILAGEVWHGELVNRRKDGSLYDEEMTLAPVQDRAGALTGFVAFKQDVTERKRAREELAFKTVLLEAQSEATLDGILVVDAEERVVFANRRFAAIFGFPEKPEKQSDAELLAHTLTRVAAPELFFERVQYLYSHPEQEGRDEVRLRDGRVLDRYTSPLTDASGKYLGRIWYFRDMTERMTAEAELRRARDAAEEASRAKSQFLANMSHEIRTPMNGVIGMTGLLLDTPLTPEQQQYAGIVRTSGESLLAVISEILDFSKIEARQLKLEKEAFDLAAVLERAVAVLALKAAEKEIELTWEIEDGMPQQLLGDSGRLRQVVLNLLGNAVKFTDRGEVALTAARDTEDGERVTLRFTVRDTGIGFAQERAQALFEPFVQADGSSTRRYGGTGLGLAISKQLVEMMGGRIGVESAEGAGATFWFTAVFEKQRKPIQAEAGPPAARAGAKVLVVDGHATNRGLLCRMLRRWECRPEGVADGETALERLREAAQGPEAFRLALIDMQLPHGNGERLGGAIRDDARLRQTALVLMTPFGQALERARLEAFGFSGQIQKPIAVRALREALLALERGGREPAGAANGNASGGATAGVLAGARILVAEDNATNQEVAAAILRKLGARADLVQNGAEAIAALARADYDLVLMDCEMPVLDGYAATAKIRAGEAGARPLGIPIVALTADAVSGDREKCIAVGMNDYIAKPVEPRHLAEVLAKWLPPLRRYEVEQASAPVFDAGALLERLMGDSELAQQVVRGFMTDVPRQLNALRKSLAAGDVGEIRRCAHTLKGGSATIAAERLRPVCGAMEAAAAAGDVGAAAALLGDVEKQVSLLSETLAQADGM